MAKRNERHRYLKYVRHQGDLRVVLEKLNGAAPTFVHCELSFHLQLNLASADDLLVRMQTVVRRFEVTLRTELVSQYKSHRDDFTREKLSTRDVISFSKGIFVIARFI